MPVPDFTNQYNTKLSPADEKKFEQWAKSHHRMGDLADYDLRGWWKNVGTQDSRGHFTDAYKKPNHPTFSNESIYNTPQDQGGAWIKGNDGKWTFDASSANLKYRTPDELKAYFGKVEPGSTLNLPKPPEEVLYGHPGAVSGVDAVNSAAALKAGTAAP